MKNQLFAFLLALGIASSVFAGNAGATDLTLQNGWTNAPFGTSNAEAFFDDGIVHFKGAIAGGTSDVLFTLPPLMRPTTAVYVPVNLCSAAKGRLYIQPSGVVSVHALVAFSDAQCFTSLDSAAFAVPEPWGHATLLSGLLLLVWMRARRRDKCAPARAGVSC